MNPFFNAVGDGVEEAILNSLTAAETVASFQGHTAPALALDELQRIMARAV